MTTWFTARELSGLPGFELTERATRDKLDRLKVPHRNRAQRGGGREFDGTALPAETRRALMIDRIASAAPANASAALPAANDALATATEQLPANDQPSSTALTPAADRRPPSQAERGVADARLVLINQVLELAQFQGTSRACQMLALQLASGSCTSELAATARTANQRARQAAVGERTLYRWLQAYQVGGWWGLLPAGRDTSATEVDEDVAAVLGLYLTRDPQFRNLTRAAMDITQKLDRDFDSWKSLASRARRALPKVNKIDVIKARHSGAERAAKLPFKRRDTSVLKPLDVWLIDGHTFKAKVRHPDHGAPFAPEVTLTIDACSRKAMGWSASLSENVTAVGDALRHAVSQHGIPALIYSDNGSGETAKQMDCPITGIVARLGADHRTGIPGHPQGHGLIERSWRTHMINCARQFGSYQGKDVDSNTFRKVAAELTKEQRLIKRAEATGEVIKLSHKAPTWAQFVDAIEKAVEHYNTQHRHRSLPKHTSGPHAGKHMTPSEAWDAMLDPSLQHRLGELELRMLFMPAMLRTAKRGEVTFLNQTYFNKDLMAVDGQQVRVHYDIHDPSFVLIFTPDGEYVCEAKWNANRIDYFPKPVVEMAREKRVRATVKRREGQIDLALRELQGSHQANAPLLLSQDDAVVLQPVMASTPSAALQAVPATLTRPVFDSAADRYEWLQSHTDRWDSTDVEWVQAYAASEDYEALKEYYQSRGLGWKGISTADGESAQGGR